ncbi:hypothetical protein VNO77_16009 [Canavalia gladiata]|uniref:Uncharacterized protein n=1 Tax=Canavalia gladiata TaxID=3824 RepID=A0AAN9LZP7_CANGL
MATASNHSTKRIIVTTKHKFHKSSSSHQMQRISFHPSSTATRQSYYREYLPKQPWPCHSNSSGRSKSGKVIGVNLTSDSNTEEFEGILWGPSLPPRSSHG